MSQHDEVRFGSARPRRPWLLPGAAGAVAALAAALLVTHLLTTHPRHRIRARPLSATTELRPHLLGVTAAWQLVTYGPAGVIRIEPAIGRVTRTPVPALASTGPVFLVTGPGQVAIRPLDGVPGYLVADGRPARVLTGALDSGGVAIPGPRPGQAWMQDGSRPAMTLAWLDGRPAGPSLRLPPCAYPVADGRGYALVSDYCSATSRLYDVRPGGRYRVGQAVVAVGPSRWLVVDCRGRRCWNEVISPASRRRWRLPGPALPRAGGTPGVISPGGQVAAVLDVAARRVSLDLISLASGRVARVPVSLTPQSAEGQTLAWSPDGRWLFVVAGSGRLAVVNPRTGRASRLLAWLPPVSQIAVRS